MTIQNIIFTQLKTDHTERTEANQTQQNIRVKCNNSVQLISGACDLRLAKVGILGSVWQRLNKTISEQRGENFPVGSDLRATATLTGGITLVPCTNALFRSPEGSIHKHGREWFNHCCVVQSSAREKRSGDGVIVCRGL